MNTKHISLAFAAAAALLAGCAKSHIEEVKLSEQFTDLELAYVGATETKAAIDGTDFPQAGEIGLFLFKDELAETPYGESGYSNVKYAYNSSKSKWTASPSIKVGSETGYLYGYYPYSATATNVKAITVKSSLNGDDVMYATKQTVTDKTASQTAITMNHALARVSIKVINNGYTGKAELSKIKFSGAKIAPEGTLNALDGKITAEKSSVTLDVTGNAQTITAAGTTYECLLVPSDAISTRQDLDLTLTIDGEDKTATLSGDNGVIIARNTKSNITITLSNKGISIQTVSVEDWNVVEVGGHKVIVKFADNVTPYDILTEAHVDGNNVIIKASSFQSKVLICNVTGDAQCVRVVTNDKFTFTISEISSDIEAVLGYAPPVTLTVTSDSNGKVWIGDDDSKTSGQFETGQQVVIHALPKDKFRFFRWNDNNMETIRTVTVGEEDITYSASFIFSDLIPSLFTVNSNGKQVFFSNGNLYWDGSKYCFEDNQYTVHTKSGDFESEHHIAHFYWSKSADVARSLSKYSDTGKPSASDIFFANKPESFEVNGHTGWSVLTGNDDGEWKYLINKGNEYGQTIRSGKYMYGVEVCGSANCLILLPDDWEWDANTVGTGWQTEYSESTTVKWSTMENAGAVCLPAAGFRYSNSDDGPTCVKVVGDIGDYWSASPNQGDKAYDLLFGPETLYPAESSSRDFALAVRLVTEYQSEPSAE